MKGSVAGGNTIGPERLPERLVKNVGPESLRKKMAGTTGHYGVCDVQAPCIRNCRTDRRHPYDGDTGDWQSVSKNFSVLRVALDDTKFPIRFRQGKGCFAKERVQCAPV
jgi:hypothetical protein